ncbi:DUF1127 domain-containing protein [Nioella sp.]|uniref:DUF1127 domain-containing protein n=1 Tax=Nioella sp. TaxID=1912091 RepID=UPI003A8C8214
MAHTTSTTPSPTNSLIRILATSCDALRRLVTTWREQRRIIRALRDVPDQYLRDIGLTRSDIEDMIRGGGSVDPARDLQKIMRERQRNW